jgi:hypothetical protein
MILAARRQHFRRQRILRRKQLEKEWAGVPDGAISRAQPPSKPEPTQGSLSRVEVLKEDPTRLQKDVEAEKEAEERPKIPIHIERR